LRKQLVPYQNASKNGMNQFRMNCFLNKCPHITTG
jgi:hypothetical protein